jgi:hypothetical protein
MAIQIEDNERVLKLRALSIDLDKVQQGLLDNGVDIGALKNKIELILDKAINKERMDILQAEMDKIKPKRVRK